MDALSLDHFRQSQDYQRQLLVNSTKSHKKHRRSHKHRSHKHKHRSGRRHTHHRRKSRKDYGSVNDQCAVCLDDETELDTRLFPCKHVFHGECLIEWVKQGESFTCPLCRQQISHFFNLSSNDKINNELVSIWNDHYMNSEVTNDSNTNTSTNIDKLEDDITLKNISLLETQLQTIETETETETAMVVKSAPVTKSEIEIAIDNDKILEEIARLKNKEINESLEIMIDNTNEINKSNDTIQEVPGNAAIEAETEAIKSQIIPVMKTVETETETIQTTEETQTTTTVWESTWSTIANKNTKDVKSKPTMKESLVQLLVPNNTFIYLMFDKYVSNRLVDCIENKKTSDENANANNILFLENGISSINDSFEYEMELNRINESMSIVNGNDTTFNRQTAKDSNDSYASMTAAFTDSNNNGSNNGGNLAASNKKFLSNTSTNFEAGIYAGICASLVTHAITNHHRMMPYMVRTSILPLMKETVPNVAMYFTGYEHLKSYVFQCDPTNKSHTQTFFERFISAGVASSIAFLPRSPNLSFGLKCVLPLRFAVFFGSFELCKDMRMEFNFLKGNYNSLNVCEVASAAAIGGVIASSVHYPMTQMVQHSGTFNNLLKMSLAGASAGGNTSATGGMSFFNTFSNVNKQAFVETMYRGFMPNLVRFIPSTVACSCAFEYAKRAVGSRKDT